MSLLQTDRPTDRLTMEIPLCYCSLRVTIKHAQIDALMPALLDTEYLLWPHKVSDEDNQHFHILIPSSESKAVDKYRKRIKACFPSLKGNGFIRAKFETNGILAGITYCAKEGTACTHSDDHHAEWLAAAPKWVHDTTNIGNYLTKKGSRPVDPDHSRELTYRNLAKCSLRYRQRTGIVSDQLEDTLEHMCKHGYALNIAIIRGGIPSPFFDEFTAVCRGTTTWSAGKFLTMRVSPGWQAY